jgi:hypothetical protein
MNMQNEIATKVLAEMSKFDKCRLWEKNRTVRIYVGKNGRFITITPEGGADVSEMRIHQAQQSAKACCERVGVSVVENI